MQRNPLMHIMSAIITHIKALIIKKIRITVFRGFMKNVSVIYSLQFVMFELCLWHSYKQLNSAHIYILSKFDMLHTTIMSMIGKNLNHTLHTNQRHREEEPQNTKSHKTSEIRNTIKVKQSAPFLFLVKMIAKLEWTLKPPLHWQSADLSVMRIGR